MDLERFCCGSGFDSLTLSSWMTEQCRGTQLRSRQGSSCWAVPQQDSAKLAAELKAAGSKLSGFLEQLD